jgi:hypothetical protein
VKNTWNKWKIINEKAKAAINTPLPNAIIEEIIFFGKLTNNATIDPIRRRILAIKPQIKESKIVYVVVIL